MICSPMTSKIKDQDNRSNSFELNVSWPQGVKIPRYWKSHLKSLLSHLPGACRQGRLRLSPLSGRSWRVGNEPQWALWNRRPGPSHRRRLSGFQASGERSVGMGSNGQKYQGGVSLLRPGNNVQVMSAMRYQPTDVGQCAADRYKCSTCHSNVTVT